MPRDVYEKIDFCTYYISSIVIAKIFWELRLCSVFKRKSEKFQYANHLQKRRGWPKKNIKGKKNILATKANVLVFPCQTFTCLGTEKCEICWLLGFSL